MPQLDNDTFWSEQFTLESSCSDNANFSLSNCTNLSSLAIAAEGEGLPSLNIPYAVMEALVAIVAVIGNALVIIVFYRERRLRRRTNYYIISLALADFLVGLLGIPFAILVSLARKLPFSTCTDSENSTSNCFSRSTGVNWPAEESLRVSVHHFLAGRALHHLDILPGGRLHRSLLGNFSS